MAQLARLVFIALMLMFPALAVAGPAEDANAAGLHDLGADYLLRAAASSCHIRSGRAGL